MIIFSDKSYLYAYIHYTVVWKFINIKQEHVRKINVITTKMFIIRFCMSDII